MATLSQLQLRDIFISSHPNVHYGLGEWRRYVGGIWEPIEESVVRRLLQTVIASYDSDLVTNHIIVSVTALLRDVVTIPGHLFDSNPNLILYNDCGFDLRTGTTVPHSETHYALSKLPYNYDPTATSPQWETFLKCCPYPEFLQEFAGYCLTTDTKHELAVWLYGPPGGGKSTFIEGLRAMLGSKATNLGLWEIERSTFGLGRIPGKTLAISAEQPSMFIRSHHVLNALISGEMLSVERKFRDPIDIEPHVKILWAMNDLPKVESSGIGLFRRVVPVLWPALSAFDRDISIKEGIKKSGMAVTNWAMIGLTRLLERGNFEIPPELLAEREMYRISNDVIQLFVDAECNEHPDNEVRSSVLYEHYVKWNKANGHKQLASNRFAAEMRRIGFKKVRRYDGWYWLKIDIKIDEAEPFNIDNLLR